MSFVPLNDVLADARARGVPYLCLDGTLIPTDRVADWVEGADGKRALRS